MGDNTTIEDKVFIGPYTNIEDNCKIMKTSPENSIIMSNSNINTENTIVDSIIGETSTIMDANSLKPIGKRLLLGVLFLYASMVWLQCTKRNWILTILNKGITHKFIVVYTIHLYDFY